jgi:hypothetical protein
MLHLVKTHHGEQKILSQILLFKIVFELPWSQYELFFINYIHNKVIQNPKNKIVKINNFFMAIKGLKNIFVKI